MTVAAHKARSDKAWADRSGWDSLYCEALDYAIPQRRPGRDPRSRRAASKIYDMTAPAAVFHGATTLVRQVIGSSQRPFTLTPGPLLRERLPARDIVVLEREMELQQRSVYPFFQAGDFDAAAHQAAIDLFAGSGYIMPMKGPSIEEPVKFIAISFDEVATARNMWGDTHLISWRCRATYDQVRETWRDGNFDDAFLQAAKGSPNREIELSQDFYKLPNGWWKFCVYAEKSQTFIHESVSRAKPVATPEFYRVPGENYGRGPLLMAGPAIKTVNTAQRIALQAAAIQMAGIWGYRAGGTFNPDNVRVGPNEFWPMHSTGGVLGPDVQRLDSATARHDVTRMVIGNLQDQIREALLDQRIVDDGGTPASASEIAARVQQGSQAHYGAFGSIMNEIMPVLVPRTMEILNEWGIIKTAVPVNRLLHEVNVVSPMAQALKADELQSMVQYVELMTGLMSNPMLPQAARTDVIEKAARQALMVTSDIVPDPAEIAASQAGQAADQVAAVAGEAAVRAAPNVVQMMQPGAAA